MADVPLNVPKAPDPLIQGESAGMSIVSNTLAVLGFLILAIIILWGLIHLVSISGFSFKSMFSSQPKIEVQAPQSAVSGTPITISWQNTSTAGGAYSFLYECENGFSFVTEGPGSVLNTVPCGMAISVGSSTMATMIPRLSPGATSASVPFSVVFAPSATGSAKETGSATIAITMSTGATNLPQMEATTSIAKPASKPVAAPSYTYRAPAKQNYSPVAHASSGPADLSVTIIATGYIDPSSGALLMNRAPQPGDIVGVEFDIANIGGSNSGSYSFQAHLPTASTYTYTSPTQASLAPGAHVVSTLKFTQLAPGGGMFTVVVNGADTNTANNEAATTVN